MRVLTDLFEGLLNLLVFCVFYKSFHLTAGFSHPGAHSISIFARVAVVIFFQVQAATFLAAPGARLAFVAVFSVAMKTSAPVDILTIPVRANPVSLPDLLAIPVEAV